MSTSISARIVYSFCCLPARKMSNNTQETKYTGIKIRRYGHAHESTSSLATKACFPVFEKTNLSSNQINALILGTSSPDVPSPATSSFVHQNLNLSQNTHCFDVASSCSSFLSAVRAGLGLLDENKVNLILGAELKHKSLHPDDKRLLSLFADGAGGVALQKSKEQNSYFQFFHQSCDSQYANHIKIPVGGSSQPTTINNIQNNKLTIQSPKKMFLVTVEKIVEAIEASVKLIHKDSHTTFFIHQANKNILEEVKKRLPNSIKSIIPTLMTDVGNMLSASLPVLRCRIYFLRALFHFAQTDLSPNNILKFFNLACNDSNKISYQYYKNGILFCCMFLNEEFFIYDESATSLETSWLNDLDKEELKFLSDLFMAEKQSSMKSYQDIFIAAGGGFTTLGMQYMFG